MRFLPTGRTHPLADIRRLSEQSAELAARSFQGLRYQSRRRRLETSPIPGTAPVTAELKLKPLVRAEIFVVPGKLKMVSHLMQLLSCYAFVNMSFLFLRRLIHRFLLKNAVSKDKQSRQEKFHDCNRRQTADKVGVEIFARHQNTEMHRRQHLPGGTDHKTNDNGG